MDPHGLIQSLIYIWIPLIAVSCGALIASAVTIPRWLYSGTHHFTAGVVLVAVCAELLPPMMSSHAPINVAIGFLLGVALLLLVKLFTRRSDGGADTSLNTSFWIASLIDLLVDGMLLAIGFNVDLRTGLFITIALSGEIFFLGLAFSTSLRAKRQSTVMIVASTFSFGAALLLGNLIGALAIALIADQYDVIFMSFGAAALLYLVTEELLNEAHHGEQNLWMCSMFFLGFILFLVIDMLMAA